MVDDTTANSNQKKVGVAVLISNKIHFKLTQVKRDKNEQYTIINRTVNSSRRHNHD